jgi:hypothetical protein
MSDFQKQSLFYRLGLLRPQFEWFHHGDCRGADAEAHEIAKSLGYKIALHPPTTAVISTRAFCKGVDYFFVEAPYLDRNRGIVNESALLLAAPRTMQEVLRSGTWATVRYARKCDRPITILAREEK